MAELARHATVTLLGGYSFEEKPAADDTPADDKPPAPERRQVSFNFTEGGSWRLSAELAPDEGAVWEKALTEMRDELFRAGEAGGGPGASAADVSWADAFVALAERALAASAADHPHRDLLHVEADQAGHLHLGPGLSKGLRRYLSCDSRVRAVFEAGARPVSVGRAFRTVPERTRTVVEDRDPGCRVPGCDRSRWPQVHHIAHWEDGGPTDWASRGMPTIRRAWSSPTTGAGPWRAAAGPRPRATAPSRRNWALPSGERLDPWPIYFNEPAA